ncbi:putative major facilitator superfamily transporter [Planoprotostelium fungivorum]|uniref:Putative major facilitator superfamily transporter n=1 Tax=Planoprotostelium fungivorum TaxID=1890364 RepID=A0A2P6NSR5_9EUKA|nr:putative major facilitator superfamily transporter [Planoprotostelium fungivorum]
MLGSSIKISEDLVGLLPSIQFTGMCIGSFVWGWSSDRFGRKSTFILTLLVGGTFGILAALAPNYATITIALFFVGFGAGGNLAVDGSVFSEFLPRKRRGQMMVLLSTFWALGSIVASTCSYLILPRWTQPDIGWRILLAIPSCSSILVGLLRLTFVESPAYLIRKYPMDKVVENMNIVAKRNGTSTVFTPDMLERFLPQNQPKEKRGVPKLKRLTTRPLLWTTLLVWSFWWFTNFGFTGFNLFLPKLLQLKHNERASDSYLHTLIYNLAGVPGSLVGAIMVESFLGRKWTMTSCCIIAGVLMIAFNFISSLDSMVPTISCICAINFFSQIMYAAYYTYTPEVFPTAARATGVGLSSFFGKLAGIIAPLLIGWLLGIDVVIVLWLDFAMMLTGTLTHRNEGKTDELRWNMHGRNLRYPGPRGPISTNLRYC